MEKAIVEFNSGQLNRYVHDVAPFEHRLKNDNRVNWVICLTILFSTAVIGVVIGFFLLPTLFSLFLGLLAGSIAGLLLMIAYYFIRSFMLKKMKQRKEDGISSCESAYIKAYQIPEITIKCNILASDFLPKKYFGPSLIYVRDDESISIVAPNYESERKEIRYSEKSVIAYSLFSDSRVLVQSEEGYVVLSPEAKAVFAPSNLPLLDVDSNLILELSDTAIRVFPRSKDFIQRHDTDTVVNPTWKQAKDALESCLEREEA